MLTPTLNAVYSKPNVRRRYEVWFLRVGLADGSGAWWFRYLLMNPGRPGCSGNPRGTPVQVWATWFPRGGTPQSFIQGFSKEQLSLSPRGATPFRLQIAENFIDENSCEGHLCLEDHEISWALSYRSTLATTMSDKGWIGFSRSPHADAIFEGEIRFDGRVFAGSPLGLGVQGHNCGYRHRNLWTWTHAIVLPPNSERSVSFEALEYDMPLGLRFRRALLWKAGRVYTFGKFEKNERDSKNLRWNFECSNPRDGSRLIAAIDGSDQNLHRLPYLKTDCSGTFEVANNSLASARLTILRPGQRAEEFETDTGAVLELAGV